MSEGAWLVTIYAAPEGEGADIPVGVRAIAADTGDDAVLAVSSTFPDMRYGYSARAIVGKRVAPASEIKRYRLSGYIEFEFDPNASEIEGYTVEDLAELLRQRGVIMELFDEDEAVIDGAAAFYATGDSVQEVER